MNQSIKIIIAVIVAVVVLYGGYRLYRHYSKPQTTAPVVAVATPTVSPIASPSAVVNNIFKTTTNAKGVSYLSDEKGMTLYTYSKDTVGVSNCTTSKCVTNWPVFGPKTMPTILPTDVTVITRADKTLQYAWKGMPLYYFVNDTKAGDILGDGVGGFTLAK